MSGETEQFVSGWTVDTLRDHTDTLMSNQHEYFTSRLVDIRVMLDERYATQTKALDAAFLAQQTAMRTALEAAEKAVATALTSAEKAVAKAEVAADKRFESVNEFRQQLSDQTSTFPSRTETNIKFEAMQAATAQNGQRIGELELRLTSRLDRNQGNEEGQTFHSAENNAHITQRIMAMGVSISILIVIVQIVIALITHKA